MAVEIGMGLGRPPSVHPSPQKALLFCPCDSSPEHSQSSFALSPTSEGKRGSQMFWWRKQQLRVLTGHKETEERWCLHSQPSWGTALRLQDPERGGVQGWGQNSWVRAASPSLPSTSTAETKGCQEILCYDPFLPGNTIHSAVNPTGSSFYFHVVLYIAYS